MMTLRMWAQLFRIRASALRLLLVGQAYELFGQSDPNGILCVSGWMNTENADTSIYESLIASKMDASTVGDLFKVIA